MQLKNNYTDNNSNTFKIATAITKLLDQSKPQNNYNSLLFEKNNSENSTFEIFLLNLK